MLLSITANAIKIMLLSSYISTLLNAAEIEETSKLKATNVVEKKPFSFDPMAAEFVPRAGIPTNIPANINIKHDEFAQKHVTWAHPEWIYVNWTYPTNRYSRDMKPSKAIKNLRRELMQTVEKGNPHSIAQAYITLGDAHMNHECKIQAYYYNVALNIGCQLNDAEILEKAYISLGNILCGGQKCIESLVWYFEALRLRNARYIRNIAQKKTKLVKYVLGEESIRNTLDAYQIEAIKAFFPRLAAFYL